MPRQLIRTAEPNVIPSEASHRLGGIVGRLSPGGLALRIRTTLKSHTLLIATSWAGHTLGPKRGSMAKVLATASTPTGRSGTGDASTARVRWRGRRRARAAVLRTLAEMRRRPNGVPRHSVAPTAGGSGRGGEAPPGRDCRAAQMGEPVRGDRRRRRDHACSSSGVAERWGACLEAGTWPGVVAALMPAVPATRRRLAIGSSRPADRAVVVAQQAIVRCSRELRRGIPTVTHLRWRRSQRARRQLPVPDRRRPAVPSTSKNCGR